MKLNFYIQNEEVYDNRGNPIEADENGVIRVDIDGVIRRFVKVKLIRWLEINPEIRQAKIPKPKPIPSQYEAKIKAKLPPKEKPPRKKSGRKPQSPEAKAAADERRRVRNRERQRRIRGSKPRVPKEPKKPGVMGRPRIERPPKVKKPSGRPRIHPIVEKKPKPVKPKILCTTTGQVFNTTYQAERVLGICRAGIYHVLKGEYKTTRGYEFEYLK